MVNKLKSGPSLKTPLGLNSAAKAGERIKTATALLTRQLSFVYYT